MKGKIIKGIAGFYYVHVNGKGIYECKAKGIFRNRKIKPLVGDDVFLDSLDENGMKGNIIEILPRRNALIRPASANVDQAMIIFAAAQPAPNLGLLDRFLLMMERQELPTIICFNKQELISGEELDRLCSIYSRQRMQSADGQCETTGRIGSDQGDTGWQNNGHGRTFRCWQVLYD